MNFESRRAFQQIELGLVERVFDYLSDIVFCVKDVGGRYTSINETFVARVNVEGKESLIGKTAAQVFPEVLAKTYESQDREVLSTGQPLLDQLERITNRDDSMGWFLASKFPVVGEDQTIIGLIGISQDLKWPNEDDLQVANLKSVVEYIRSNLDQPLRTEAVARTIDLSALQLDRRMKRIFRLSTKKFIMKCRLEEASRQLATTDVSLSEIALRCGFSDQSALTRQFRAATSDTPASFRKKVKTGEADAGGNS